jgi:hypothetical protein
MCGAGDDWYVHTQTLEEIQKEKEEAVRLERLAKHFWVIRNSKGEDVTLPKSHATEESAWKVVVDKYSKVPLSIEELKAKGYCAEQINTEDIQRHYNILRNKGYI